MAHFIGQQQVEKVVDVMFGGARAFFQDDEERLMNLAREKGYQIITNAEEMRSEFG